MVNAIEKIVNEIFNCNANQFKQFENVANNSVYSFKCNDKRYIFKFFRNEYWPEDGKLQFVNQALLENDILCAELITFTRDNPDFPNGYLIEQELNGITADKLQFTQSDEIEFYKILAVLVSNIHRISIKGFGYIGDGEGDSESMCSFFDEEFDDRTEPLIEKGIYTEAELQELKKVLLNTLKCFDDLPSVLCHGDLSKKNVIVQENGELVLIDWDDAMSYNWMADIARFTFWMKMNYSEQDYSLFKNAFLDSYNGYRKDEFDVFENAFHIYISLDFLNFAINIGDSNIQQFAKEYLTQLIQESRQRN